MRNNSQGGLPMQGLEIRGAAHPAHLGSNPTNENRTKVNLCNNVAILRGSTREHKPMRTVYVKSSTSRLRKQPRTPMLTCKHRPAMKRHDGNHAATPAP